MHEAVRNEQTTPIDGRRFFRDKYAQCLILQDNGAAKLRTGHTFLELSRAHPGDRFKSRTVHTPLPHLIQTDSPEHRQYKDLLNSHAENVSCGQFLRMILMFGVGASALSEAWCDRDPSQDANASLPLWRTHRSGTACRAERRPLGRKRFHSSSSPGNDARGKRQVKDWSERRSRSLHAGLRAEPMH